MAVGTDKGHERVNHLFALANAQEKEVLQHLGSDDVDTLKTALKALVRNSDPVVN